MDTHRASGNVYTPGRAVAGQLPAVVCARKLWTSRISSFFACSGTSWPCATTTDMVLLGNPEKLFAIA